jgi:transposase
MPSTIIGLDLAKPAFQVHGIDAHGEEGVGRRLSRGSVLSLFPDPPACAVGLEPCATRRDAFQSRRSIIGKTITSDTNRKNSLPSGLIMSVPTHGKHVSDHLMA